MEASISKLSIMLGIQTKAPRKTGALLPIFVSTSDSGRDLSRCGLQELAGARDWDCPGLHGFRNLPHKLDVEEPVVQARALDRNMVGELEATLEGPSAMPR